MTDLQKYIIKKIKEKRDEFDRTKDEGWLYDILEMTEDLLKTLESDEDAE